MIRYALFDLDETLYPPEAGVLRAIDLRIERYLIERMGMAPDQAASLRAEYMQRYGTTLGGLLAHHAADAEDYLAYVHDVPVESLLQPNARLDRTLQELPWEPVIFTNADRRHAERVLGVLGIRSHFRRIFDIAHMGYRQKPNPMVYRQVLAELGAPGEACLLVEDSLRNLLAAKAQQMTTVWVGPDALPTEGIDHCIAEVTGIAQVVVQIRARSS